ncbi:MAG TPA: hypothetical protein VK762_36780, partial [Polyangiaceae bacterium]|nr:hypothetical protein [Polyangiaceae bacterium]
GGSRWRLRPEDDARRVEESLGALARDRAGQVDDARLLGLAGLPTRFVSLGHFGHGYPADKEERMREPMAWVAGSEDGS